MKRFFPLFALILAAALLAAGWLPPKAAEKERDLVALGKSPALVGGRVKPGDTGGRSRHTRGEGGSPSGPGQREWGVPQSLGVGFDERTRDVVSSTRAEERR